MGTITRIGRAATAGLTCLVLSGLAAGAPGARAAAAGPSQAGGSPVAAFRALVPSPGSLGQLSAVTCTSARSCWAVGSYLSGPRHSSNEALHWNGTTWSVVPTPDPGTAATDHNGLGGVTCTGPGNCWAAGEVSSFPYQASRNEALHWNGIKWSMVTVPDPGHDAGGLYGLGTVSCPLRHDCWAIGGLITANGIHRTVVLHWNGAIWSAVTMPRSAGDLSGLACISPADCWIIGSRDGLNEAMHWNGTRWSVVPTPRHGDNAGGLACTAARNCWTAGTSMLHWNGARWSAAVTPRRPRPIRRNGIACTGKKNCWAVEEYFNSAGTGLSLAIHWNGTRWSKVSMPQLGGIGPDAASALFSVACTSPSNCWAVGTAVLDAGIQRNEALHWNGTRWTRG
jgi:hypothetical protein